MNKMIKVNATTGWRGKKEEEEWEKEKKKNKNEKKTDDQGKMHM